MTDRELLELAAKAAGLTIKPVEMKNVAFAGDDRFIGYSIDPHEWLRGWFNPLTDDGDALRLAVKLGILSRHNNDMLNMLIEAEQKYNLRDAATRRAIVLAAAEIGKEMK